MVTATTEFDQKRDMPFPIRRKVVPVTIAADGTIGTTNIGLNGRIIKMIYDVPALVDGAHTVTIAILDEDTTSHYSKATLPDATITVDNTMVAAATPHGVVVAGTMTVKATASGAQTGVAASINIIILLI